MSNTDLADSADKHRLENWIREARDGSRSAQGNLMAACRNYLLSVAAHTIDYSLQAKVGPSDLVQETTLEAHRDFSHFEGEQLEELLAWLRQILLHNAANVNRHFQRTEKRKVSREVAWDIATQNGMDVPDDSPSPDSFIASREEQQSIERALEQLPPDMRQAIVLRNKEHLTFGEIGARLQRSDEAARKVWARGIERLQQILLKVDEPA
jgi:RNA polymerase sigma-70 factor (ECF subfamily)